MYFFNQTHTCNELQKSLGVDLSCFKYRTYMAIVLSDIKSRVLAIPMSVAVENAKSSLGVEVPHHYNIFMRVY